MSPLIIEMRFESRTDGTVAAQDSQVPYQACVGNRDSGIGVDVKWPCRGYSTATGAMDDDALTPCVLPEDRLENAIGKSEYVIFNDFNSIGYPASNIAAV